MIQRRRTLALPLALLALAPLAWLGPGRALGWDRRAGSRGDENQVEQRGRITTV